MKIGPAADKPLLPPSAVASDKASSAPAPVASTGSGQQPPGTTVELSQAAAALRSAPVSPEFDAEKVARISAAIAEGRFQVNPGVIADRLIANARELLDGPSN
jgi:negative regulator of flagellin synthesis FlgM